MKQLIHQEEMQKRLFANILQKEMQKREFEERARRVMQDERMRRLDRRNRALPMDQKVAGIPQFQVPNMPRLCFALIKDLVDGDAHYIKNQKEIKAKMVAEMNDIMEPWNREMRIYYDLNNQDDSWYYEMNEYDHYENGQLILSWNNVQRIDEQHQGVIEANESDYYVKEKKKSSKTYKTQHEYEKKKKFRQNY